MAISPITEILADIRAGRMVILIDEEDRENEGDLVLAADFVTAETINFMARYGRGLICLTLTEEKGNVTTVAGRLDANAFAIDGPRGHERLESCVMTFAYWNPRVLKQSGLINFQTGAWTPITVHTLGKEQIDVRGKSVAADHFRIDTERNRIELWYSPEGEWIGLRSTTRNGHVLEYRLR